MTYSRRKPKPAIIVKQNIIYWRLLITWYYNLGITVKGIWNEKMFMKNIEKGSPG